MGFWDKFEKMLETVAENAEKFEKKANDFLEKNFPDEEPKKAAQRTYTAQELLTMTKEKAMEIAGSRLLERLKELHSATSRMRRSVGEGSYNGLDIATAEITRITEEDERDPRLVEVQYKLTLKGVVEGESDYGTYTTRGKYDVEMRIDEQGTYFLKRVSVRDYW